MNPDLKNKVKNLQGPVLVLGASGFVGANLFRMLLAERPDVFGTSSQSLPWRLEGLPEKNILVADLLVEENLERVLEASKPRTVFNCVAYGAYSFETEAALIYRTNLNMTVRLLERLLPRGLAAYIHAGSSSEYGDNAAAPREDAALSPNSHYSVSKGAVSGLLQYYGKKFNFPAANLRLYSAYGPFEDASRLVPQLLLEGLRGGYPPLVDPDVSRDFIYVKDACEAFVDAALKLRPEAYGESFNIGSGLQTSIRGLAGLSQKIFSLPAEASFGSMPNRAWDLKAWRAEPAKAREALGWSASTPLEEGLRETAAWLQGLKDPARYRLASRQYGVDRVYSVSAVVACYKDGQAIPHMYRRLRAAFEALNVDFEIIFVNDNSPDGSEETIREISSKDRRVLGVSHSRNFGSQAAFRSGMALSSKNACVLLDGDLQDPPELIAEFVAKWKEGFEVVYGRRVRRVATPFMQLAYKLFYRLFKKFSYIDIPQDAGDFSLMDKKVVSALLRFPERDLFVRGIRAFAGFRQCGVDYVRPERLFGVSTNNFLRNVGWAKKGILSFTRVPLDMLSSFSVILVALSMLLALAQAVMRLAWPDIAPKGVTTTLILIAFFGSVNLLGISILGEYIAKIFEEVKRRPHYIRRNIIRDGELREASGLAIGEEDGRG
jgi:nucleoside-diphosphate-sugar epimerase/glycosyltransferase involved in cell wall biosynthesis